MALNHLCHFQISGTGPISSH